MYVPTYKQVVESTDLERYIQAQVFYFDYILDEQHITYVHGHNLCTYLQRWYRENINPTKPHVRMRIKAIL